MAAQAQGQVQRASQLYECEMLAMKLVMHTLYDDKLQNETVSLLESFMETLLYAICLREMSTQQRILLRRS